VPDSEDKGGTIELNDIALLNTRQSPPGAHSFISAIHNLERDYPEMPSKPGAFAESTVAARLASPIRFPSVEKFDDSPFELQLEGWFGRRSQIR